MSKYRLRTLTINHATVIIRENGGYVMHESKPTFELAQYSVILDYKGVQGWGSVIGKRGLSTDQVKQLPDYDKALESALWSLNYNLSVHFHMVQDLIEIAE